MNRAERAIVQSALETELTAELIDDKGNLTDKAIVLLIAVAADMVKRAIKTIVEIQQKNGVKK